MSQCITTNGTTTNGGFSELATSIQPRLRLASPHLSRKQRAFISGAFGVLFTAASLAIVLAAFAYTMRAIYLQLMHYSSLELMYGMAGL